MANQGLNKKNNFAKTPEKKDGCALDNKATSKHHQLFSVEQLPNSTIYRLNYMVSCPEREGSILDIIPDGFIQLAHSKNPIAQKLAKEKFAQINDYIIDTEKQEIFVDDEYKQSLNFKFDFNTADWFNLVDQSVEICTSQINSVTTYQEANTELKDCTKKEELILWNRFVTRQKLGNTPKGFLLPFEDVVNLTTKMVQEFTARYSVAENIECILRRKQPTNNRTDQYCYINTQRSQEPKASKYHWTAPITTSALVVPALNNMAVSKFEENSTNLFSPEMAEALSCMAPYAKDRKSLSRIYS